MVKKLVTRASHAQQSKGQVKGPSWPRPRCCCSPGAGRTRVPPPSAGDDHHHRASRSNDAAVALCASTIASAEARDRPAPSSPPAAPGRPRCSSSSTASSAPVRRGRGHRAEPGVVSRAVGQKAQGIEAMPADAARRLPLRSSVGFQESAADPRPRPGRDSLRQPGRHRPRPRGGRPPRGPGCATSGPPTVEIEVDPRFGEYADGGRDTDERQLSIPVSERAARGPRPSPVPSETWPGSRRRRSAPDAARSPARGSPRADVLAGVAGGERTGEAARVLARPPAGARGDGRRAPGRDASRRHRVAAARRGRLRTRVVWLADDAEADRFPGELAAAVVHGSSVERRGAARVVRRARGPAARPGHGDGPAAAALPVGPRADPPVAGDLSGRGGLRDARGDRER